MKARGLLPKPSMLYIPSASNKKAYINYGLGFIINGYTYSSLNNIFNYRLIQEDSYIYAPLIQQQIDSIIISKLPIIHINASSVINHEKELNTLDYILKQTNAKHLSYNFANNITTYSSFVMSNINNFTYNVETNNNSHIIFMLLSILYNNRSLISFEMLGVSLDSKSIQLINRFICSDRNLKLIFSKNCVDNTLYKSPNIILLD
jgi:hypothetical protein